MIILALIIVGLCLGSFVNALVWRLHKQAEVSEKPKSKGQPSPKELSIVTGRSMCSHCHHSLATKDLVPVVSWLLLKGRCRYCHHRIEDTPIPELLTAMLFVLSYFAWPNSLRLGWPATEFSFWLLFVVGFVALAFYDLRWLILPDKIVWPLVGLAVVQDILHLVFVGGGWPYIVGVVASIAVASGIFYVIFQVSRGTWIGGGDVKLGLLLGLLLASPLLSFMLLFIASLLGTLVSLPLVLAKKAGRKTAIPFGPFLLIAAFVLGVFGTSIVTWINSRLFLY